VPADLTPEQTRLVQDTARTAFLALDCRGLARVDFFLGTGADGADRLVVNEVNTMPGFTPISMYPRMWAATGVDFAALVDRLVEVALAARPAAEATLDGTRA
jgi:D-alanine-D-alanine ligase